MVIVLLIAAALVVLSVTIHVVTLRRLSRIVLRWQSIPVTAMGVAMVGAILGHLVEIELFAVAIQGMAQREDFGRLVGNMGQTAEDYFYFSAVTYTSLGFGDIVPAGPLRLLSAIEALTGLVLIAWTASFAFLLMQRLWNDRATQGDRIETP
jgi:Ion channel